MTSPPLRTFVISAMTLLNGRFDTLQLVAAGSEKVPWEQSKILHFVRTPAGRGVAVVRAEGGETWMITESGSNLSRLNSWSSADHVVVLDGGKYEHLCRLNPRNLTCQQENSWRLTPARAPY
jgi:hypothetical protein